MADLRDYVWLLLTVTAPMAASGAAIRDCQPAQIDSVINNSPLCPGDHVELSVVTSGNIIGFSWQGPGTGIFFSFGPNFTFQSQALGEYTITAYGFCGDDTATTTVSAEGAGAGHDHGISLCDQSPPLQLASLLGMHDDGGTWTHDGEPHSGYFVPGTDLPGDYLYTLPEPPTCPNVAQSATVSVAVSILGQAQSVSLCETDDAFNLMDVLEAGATPEGTWFRQVFLAMEPHSGIYDPAIDSSGVFRYTVGDCFVTVNVEEVPLTAWFDDADGDGYGDPATMIWSCEALPGQVADSTDTCPELPGRMGDPCDDGLTATINDMISDSCTCSGEYHTQVGGPGQAGTPSLHIWPNPGRGEYFHLKSAATGPAELWISDLGGRIILAERLYLTNSPQLIRTGRPLPAGPYTVRLIHAAGTETRVLLVQ